MEGGDHIGRGRCPADDAALSDDHLERRALKLGEVALRRVGHHEAFVAA
eukprot:CAMPEP_0185338042 /NCGR_PEP_ID=MMETSP1363-20130426/94467_1 /TAXON_ID=38817 /ORGANISM="Gephyrocapsa oceanica, Strain RCC1303" /LENGTH=48 /DNA_ID= /DNA_START= /DNA_END= /DNA_ORIENTATION=